MCGYLNLLGAIHIIKLWITLRFLGLKVHKGPEINNFQKGHHFCSLLGIIRTHPTQRCIPIYPVTELLCCRLSVWGGGEVHIYTKGKEIMEIYSALVLGCPSLGLFPGDNELCMLWLICRGKRVRGGATRKREILWPLHSPEQQSFSKEGPQTIPSKPLRMIAWNADSLALFEVSESDSLGLGWRNLHFYKCYRWFYACWVPETLPKKKFSMEVHDGRISIPMYVPRWEKQTFWTNKLCAFITMLWLLKFNTLFFQQGWRAITISSKIGMMKAI